MDVFGVEQLYKYWINDAAYFSVMKTVDKMPKYMDFEETLNCAIQKRKFLIQRKIDGTSDEDAAEYEPRWIMP